MRSQYTAAEPVVQQLANYVAQSTEPLTQRTALLMLLQPHTASGANVSTKHTRLKGEGLRFFGLDNQNKLRQVGAENDQSTKIMSSHRRNTQARAPESSLSSLRLKR